MSNKYGLDVRYFKEKMSLIVRDIDCYSPDEMMRELFKYGMVAASQGDIKVKIDIKYPTTKAKGGE